MIWCLVRSIKASVDVVRVLENSFVVLLAELVVGFSDRSGLEILLYPLLSTSFEILRFVDSKGGDQKRQLTRTASYRL